MEKTITRKELTLAAQIWEYMLNQKNNNENFETIFKVFDNELKFINTEHENGIGVAYTICRGNGMEMDGPLYLLLKTLPSFMREYLTYKTVPRTQTVENKTGMLWWKKTTTEVIQYKIDVLVPIEDINFANVIDLLNERKEIDRMHKKNELDKLTSNFVNNLTATIKDKIIY